MSRRFGRNQRRRAREALAAAQEQAGRYETAYVMTQGLARSLGEDVRVLKQTLNEAMATAGRMSVLFPANALELNINAPASGRVQVDVPELVDYGTWTANVPAEWYARNYVAELDTLIASIRRYDFDMAIHADVRFADGTWRYAATAKSILAMGRARAEREFTTRIASEFARKLVDANITRR